jgi:hypothetical protein
MNSAFHSMALPVRPRSSLCCSSGVLWAAPYRPVFVTVVLHTWPPYKLPGTPFVGLHSFPSNGYSFHLHGWNWSDSNSKHFALSRDFDVLTAVTVTITVFWDETPCSLADRYCLHLHNRWIVFYPEHGNSRVLRNADTHLQRYTVKHLYLLVLNTEKLTLAGVSSDWFRS